MTSFTPVIVTVTTWVVPSALTAVKLSVAVTPAPRLWIAVCVLSAEYVQAPSVPSVNVPKPFEPAVLACAANTASLVSASVMESDPPTVSVAASSSVTSPVVVPAITAPSLIPVIVTMTTWVVPSALTAVKLSVAVTPAPRLWIAVCVLSAEYVQAPSVPSVNVPKPFEPAVLACAANTASLVSASDTVSVPLVASAAAASSVTDPVVSPPTTATSFTPASLPPAAAAAAAPINPAAAPAAPPSPDTASASAVSSAATAPETAIPPPSRTTKSPAA